MGGDFDVPIAKQPILVQPRVEPANAVIMCYRQMGPDTIGYAGTADHSGTVSAEYQPWRGTYLESVYSEATRPQYAHICQNATRVRKNGVVTVRPLTDVCY